MFSGVVKRLTYPLRYTGRAVIFSGGKGGSISTSRRGGSNMPLYNFCSKQHAVIQFRQAEEEGADGTLLKEVKPYIVDLGSTNKTFVNGVAVEPQRYYELVEKDTIRFGNSSREVGPVWGGLNHFSFSLLLSLFSSLFPDFPLSRALSSFAGNPLPAAVVRPSKAATPVLSRPASPPLSSLAGERCHNTAERKELVPKD
ncbi:hypothetical protein ACLB2K_054547 [Fragaria x ananassa]